MLTRMILVAALTAILSQQGSTVEDTTEHPLRPMLGIGMSPVPMEVQRANGIGAYDGVYVWEVFPTTAADIMDIRVGDVLFSIDDVAITNMTDFRREVDAHPVGAPVRVKVFRKRLVLFLNGRLGGWRAEISRMALDADAEQSWRDWEAMCRMFPPALLHVPYWAGMVPEN